MKINLTVIVKSKIETIEITKTLLTEMALYSKLEKACIQYDLHQNNDNPTYFIFHEIWENEEGLKEHNTKTYIKKFVEMSSQILAENLTIYKTSKIA